MGNTPFIELFSQVTPDTTIITPNRRLAATLHQHYQRFQLSHSNNSWQTPDILPLQSWLQRLWNDYLAATTDPAPLLLNGIQTAFLWEEVICQSKDNERLLQLSETADIAYSAWKLIKQWRIDINHPVFLGSEDYAAFKQWAGLLEQQFKKRQWLDEASLPDQLAQLMLMDKMSLPKQLVMVGFTDISPQINYLLEACEKNNTVVKQVTLLNQNVVSNRISLETTDKEIETIARWAKSIYEQDANVTIGCVIPNLDKIRDRANQLFTDVFTDSNAFNISAGKRLIDYPLIYSALQLLQLNKKMISRETISYLLLSPFIGEAETERMRRATTDCELRKKNIQQISLAKQIDSVFKSCRYFTNRLALFYDYLHTLKEKQTYAEWAETFMHLLTLLGWPGERSLNSEEYQTMEAWMRLLNEFSTLDYIALPVNLYDAVNTLKQLAKKNIFQPKTPIAPIQVLGVLEAAGIPFDYLWVAGMDDIAWPPQPKPNPFIPKKLQRELQMPHATAERELRFCTLLTEQFQQSASTVIFSHAEKKDEIELQASSLIRHLSMITNEDLLLTTYLTPYDTIYRSKDMEILTDHQAPAVLAEEKITGGVSIIKQQALCPFKAFAEKRLHARALESALPGLRPNERGELIHAVLEILWNQLGDQATLLAKTASELTSLINNSITQAFNTFHPPALERVKYMQLEHERLFRVISEWLLLEKERPDFKVVCTEKSTEITLNQLTLTTRVDRIDELADGKRLIIDYKTGKHNDIHQWLSDRPDEPQLPLYALEDPEHTIGIAFAQLAPGHHSFKGMSQYSLDIKGIKPLAEMKSTTTENWNSLLNQWKNTMIALSNDFYAGVATVDPKDQAETCQWCELKSLCRINEEDDALCQLI